MEEEVTNRHRPTPHNNYITNLKATLPSTRTRLSALRSSLDEDPSSDPDRMAELASDYWSKIWSPRPAESKKRSPGDYYGDPLPNPGPDLPPIPSVDHIMEAISTSGNSCPGPDGIPFSAWRAIAKYAAPVLHLCLLSISQGGLPPAGFNRGLLFLLPKKGTLLASDTRPISVTNADNRIIAIAVVNAITPFLDDSLHPSQKGFIKGRSFEDHIRDLNEKLYKAVEGNVQNNLFILFMDTAKAFDSIDHGFIFESIRRIGLPPWFSSLIHGLLHQVQVKPAFRGARDRWINIRRGVKQGCPLSPLLFVICYDVLLRRISDLPNANPYACADDLAVASPLHLSLWPVMRLVDDFREASGLGINIDKTRILMAKEADISRCLKPVTMGDHLHKCPWPGVKVAQDYKYLGVLFGREVTTHDVYRDATKSMIDRATAFHVALRSLDHKARVIAYNTFILTKLSYLMKFFHIPYTDKTACTEGRAKALARKLILPLPGAYHHSFLVSNPKRFSPSPPARDAWALSMATLISQNNLHQWQGEGEEEGSVTFHPEDLFSMRISRHIRSAAADFVCRWTAFNDRSFDASLFDHQDPRLRRKSIYDCLLNFDHHHHQDQALFTVLTRRGLTHCKELVPILHSNFALLPANFPTHLRNTQFDLTMNCLFTTKRMGALKGDHPEGPKTCYICGHHEDSASHLFGGECEPLVTARRLINSTLKFYGKAKASFPSLDPDEIGAADYWSSSLLAFPRPGRSLDKRSRRRAVEAMILFNGVVWYQRVYHFRLLSTPPPAVDATSRIIASVAQEYLRVSCTATTGSTNRAAKRAAARDAAREAIGRIGPDTLVAFTDGSASPNPGPTGAGAFVYSNHPQASCHLEAYAALGKGTNNLGEIWAIGMAAQMATTHLSTVPNNTFSHLKIFTDSAFARASVLGLWKTNNYQGIVRKVRSLLDNLRARVDLDIIWVVAHAGIEANEHADMLAGLGTKRSRKGRIDVCTDRDFKTGNFLPARFDSPN